MTPEQTELIEKLNCLEFETSQLNHAYQLWRSNVEQGTAPDWMAAAIRITYEALIAFCLDSASALALDTSDTGAIESGALAEPASLLAANSVSALCVPDGHPFQYEHAETDPPVHFTALVDGSLALTPVRQQNRIVGMLALADVPPAFSARHLAQLEAATGEISCILGEESATAEPSPELLPMTNPEWAEPVAPVVISPDAISPDAIPEQPAIQHVQQEGETGAEPAVVQSLATLRLPNWLQGSSSRLFGAASMAILASVIILMVAGGAMGIYLASSSHASPSSDAPSASAGAVAIPTGAKAEFKFDPDPVIAKLGSSFVLNAVLARGSDIGSVAVEIDYDANLLQFMGVSEGGSLVNAGQNFVLAQRDDPLTGVLKISAEQAPGNPGISGDGPVFALSFQARKKGNGTVSIVPGAHDSQGRRIETSGAQVSVRIN